jgi:hypothetical protein
VFQLVDSELPELEEQIGNMLNQAIDFLLEMADYDPWNDTSQDIDFFTYKDICLREQVKAAQYACRRINKF